VTKPAAIDRLLEYLGPNWTGANCCSWLQMNAGNLGRTPSWMGRKSRPGAGRGLNLPDYAPGISSLLPHRRRSIPGARDRFTPPDFDSRCRSLIRITRARCRDPLASLWCLSPSPTPSPRAPRNPPSSSAMSLWSTEMGSHPSRSRFLPT